MQSAMSIHSLSFYKLNCLIPINKSTKTADFAFRDFLFLHFRRRAASAVTPSRDRNAPRADLPSSDCAATPLHAKPHARPHSHAFPCAIFLLSKPRLALPYPEPPPFFRASMFHARPPPRALSPFFRTAAACSAPRRPPTARRCRASRTAHLVRIALSASDCPADVSEPPPSPPLPIKKRGGEETVTCIFAAARKC